MDKPEKRFPVLSVNGQTYVGNYGNSLTCFHALPEEIFNQLLIGKQSIKIAPLSDNDIDSFLRLRSTFRPNGQGSQEEWIDLHHQVLARSSDHTFELWEENIGETEYTKTTVSLTKNEIVVSSVCVVTQPYENYPKPSRALETWTIKSVFFQALFKFLEVKDWGSLLEKLDGANVGVEILKMRTFAAESSGVKEVFKYNHETDVTISLDSMNSITIIKLYSVYSRSKFKPKLEVTVQYKKEISELDKTEISERGGLDRDAETWIIDDELLPALFKLLGVVGWHDLKGKLEKIETEAELSEIRAFAKDKSVFRRFQKFVYCSKKSIRA